MKCSLRLLKNLSFLNLLIIIFGCGGNEKPHPLMWKVRTGLVSLIHYCRAMDGMTTLHAWSYSNNMLNINY